MAVYRVDIDRFQEIYVVLEVAGHRTAFGRFGQMSLGGATS